MKLAFLFAGQGAQLVGMGEDLAERSVEARSVFAAADRALGYALTTLMAQGPEKDLRRTAVAQPALLTVGVAQARFLQEVGIHPDVLIGHSLGEYAALVVAGALEFASAVRLVAARGELMQAAVPEGTGAMAAILGLDREQVYAACAQVGTAGIVDVACHNAPTQTVISGTRAAVDAAIEQCEAAGGGAVPLPVSAPFHCRLLESMVSPFAELVEAADVAAPMLPVVDNVTAQPLTDATSVRRALIAQVTAPVLFEESLRYVAEQGVQRFIQCGPGDALLRCAQRVVAGSATQTFAQATGQHEEREAHGDRTVPR